MLNNRSCIPVGCVPAGCILANNHFGNEVWQDQILDDKANLCTSAAVYKPKNLKERNSMVENKGYLKSKSIAK